MAGNWVRRDVGAHIIMWMNVCASMDHVQMHLSSDMTHPIATVDTYLDLDQKTRQKKIFLYHCPPLTVSYIVPSDFGLLGTIWWLVWSILTGESVGSFAARLLANYPTVRSDFFHANLLCYVLYFQLLKDCWQLVGTFFEQLELQYIWKGSRGKNRIFATENSPIVKSVRKRGRGAQTQAIAELLFWS